MIQFYFSDAHLICNVEPFKLLKEMKSTFGNLNRLGADDFLSLSNQAFFMKGKEYVILSCTYVFDWTWIR